MPLPSPLPPLLLVTLFFTVSAGPFAGTAPAQTAPPLPPDEIYGELFTAVQTSEVFADSKTFVDCVPRRDPAAIVSDYRRLAAAADFDLKAFVKANFLVPGADVVAHIERLWKQLRREADVRVEGSSLLPLPYPYLVPGGRFREIYYWDSYFTMLGLRESGETELIESMVKNFAALIDTFGFIPNGNRTYYLSRSQPPFFSLMVELLAEIKGDAALRQYLPALRREYDYWMDRSHPTQHVVTMPDGSTLNRYYDRSESPRQESFREDVATSRKSDRDPKETFRDLRSAAESGWDFSSRWFADGKTLATIQTTSLVPVDLNCLLHHLEMTLARALAQSGDAGGAGEFRKRAEARKSAINRFCWNPQAGWYVDYATKTNVPGSELTLAGVAPLFFRIAPEENARAMVDVVRTKFLKAGGVVTSLRHTGEQWDAPNGWAPLQWLAIRGLANYGEDALARDIARRWVTLNVQVFTRTGKLLEKYDVIEVTKESGGGEYPTQDGFGWTNGVLLKLIKLYGLPELSE